MLTSAHISLSGTVLIGGAPKSTMLLASHSSEPLSKLMADTLKPSDNVYADSLFLHTVAYLNGSPLNWDRAQSVAKTFLQHQTGIDFSNAVMIDGSGLSRFNRVSAKQTVALLSYIYTHFSIAQDYIAALPIAGVDGTLEHRFRKPGMQGLIRAKTGYMKGIFGLSGYAFTPNGHTLAFSIYINRIGKSNATGSYRGLIDQLCEIMVKLTPTGGQAFRPQNINPTLAFQYRPSTPAASRATSAKWRQLETALRHALNNQPVSITYHANSLVLQDSSSNAHMVLAALQGLAQKYAFAVALESSTLSERNGHLRLMWIKNNQSEGMRIWKIFPTVN